MRLLAALALLLGSGCATVPPATPGALVVRNVSVIDPAAGAVRPGQTIRVEGERIVAVGPSRAVAARGARVIDGSGKYVVPGLWDMHTHLSGWGFGRAFPMLVANGVLGVRDMGNPDMAAPRAASEQVKAGAIPSVRFFAAGLRLDGPTNPLFTSRLIVATPEEGRAAVRGKVEEGAPFIKIMARLDKPTFMAIAEEAKARSIRFAGHLPAPVSAIEAADAGMWTIEHGFRMPECDEGKSCPALTETTEALKRNGVWLVPTMAAEDGQVRVYSAAIPAEQRALITQEGRETWAKQDAINSQFYPPVPERLKAFSAGVAGGLRMTAILHKHGVKLLAGTDLGGPGTLPGFSLHRQLELLVQAGLSPLEALRAATSNPVAALGLEKDLGRVEAGKYADFLILNRNPLEDITATNDIHGVVANGRPYIGVDRRSLLTPSGSGTRA